MHVSLPHIPLISSLGSVLCWYLLVVSVIKTLYEGFICELNMYYFAKKCILNITVNYVNGIIYLEHHDISAFKISYYIIPLYQTIILL